MLKNLIKKIRQAGVNVEYFTPVTADDKQAVRLVKKLDKTLASYAGKLNNPGRTDSLAQSPKFSGKYARCLVSDLLFAMGLKFKQTISLGGDEYLTLRMTASEGSRVVDGFMVTKASFPGLNTDGDVREAQAVELHFSADKLAGISDFNTMSDIIRTIADAIRTGQLADRTGLAEVRHMSGEVVLRQAMPDTPLFYSNAARGLEAIRQDKATPAQWLAMLNKNGGIKAGEDKWMGLSEWLMNHTGKTLDKNEVRSFIHDNTIRIEEKIYLDPFTNENILEGLQAEFDEYVNEGEDATGSLFYADYLDYAFRMMTEQYGRAFYQGFVKGDDGKLMVYSADPAVEVLGIVQADKHRLEYTTDYLENKKELALYVPGIEPWQKTDTIHFGDAGEGRCIAWVRFGDTTEVYTYTPEERQAMMSDMPGADAWQKVTYDRQYVPEVWYPPVKNDRYPHAHISMMHDNYRVWDVGNMLNTSFPTLEDAVKAYNRHVVPKEKVTRILVIDEIQSARHEQGRKEGYKSTYVPNELDKYIHEMTQKYGDNWTQDTLTPEENARLDSLAGNKENFKPKKVVPDAPFEKNWHELAMKRMLHYAAENGYDILTWTTGEQQAVRYDIGQVVEYYSSEPYEAQSPGETDGFDVDIYTNAGKIVLFVDKDGIICSGEVNGQSSFVGQPLEKMVGQQVAGKILSSTEPLHAQYLYDDFRFGYDAMHKFYDEMLPSFMNRYVKKWDTKVEQMTLIELEPRDCEKYGIRINEAMKRDVLQGQPMFMRDREGQVYGFAVGDTIYLTGRGLNTQTLLHEYTHLWAAAMQHGNPEGWQSVKDLLYETPAWQAVVDDPMYRDIAHDDDLVTSEVLARISGRANADKLDRVFTRTLEGDRKTGSATRMGDMLERLRQALHTFWSWVGRHMFDIRQFRSVDEVTDRVLYDLLRADRLETGKVLHSAPPLDTSRISHVQVFKGLHGQPHIRCKVDGVQQMGVPIKPQELDAIHDKSRLPELAERYFQHALNRTESHNQSIRI